MPDCKGGNFRGTTLLAVINQRPLFLNLSYETVSPVTWRKRPCLLALLCSEGCSGVMSHKRLSAVFHHMTALCNQVSFGDVSLSMHY